MHPLKDVRSIRRALLKACALKGARSKWRALQTACALIILLRFVKMRINGDIFKHCVSQNKAKN